MRPRDLQPGDVIEWPYGIRRELMLAVVHDVRIYPTPWRGAGSASVRYRPLSNPRAVDWSGFMEETDPDVRLVSRGVCRVDAHIRSLLPA